MSDADDGPVRVERTGPVMVITLARPDARNSFDEPTALALRAAFDELDADDDARCGVLTGEGGFSAGLDLKAFLDEGLPRPLLELFERGTETPLVAAVEGYALAGGLELALTCDLIVAGEGARFGIPEVGVGLFAGGGGLFRLPDRIGLTRTLELALTGRPIDAARAEEIGLVSSVVPAGTAVEAARDLAATIAGNAPLGVRSSKRIVWGSIGIGDAESWRMQEPLLDEILSSADAVEGPSAFAEKRAPKWTGR
ncbi:MAG: enoyl-CoA hydratase-related protein [Actinomycetota bacterium]